MKRKVYHVVRREGAWHVRRAGAKRSGSVHQTKISAIVRAKFLARAGRALGQVRVHGKDGRLQVEWTYGRDPERKRG